jgi:hypothetical protein
MLYIFDNMVIGIFMKKSVSVSLIAVAVLIAVFAAGCTSQTASPTPNPSEAQSTGTASTAKMASYVHSLGYNVTAPFTKSALPVTFSFGERDQYSPSSVTVKDSKNKDYITTAIVCKSSADTSDVFSALTSQWKKQGYAPAETNSTTTTLVNSQGVHVIVSQNTADNFVVQMKGIAAS